MSQPTKVTWISKQIKQIKKHVATIREKLEFWRDKNPKVFDGIAHFAEILWVVGTTYCSNIFSNTFVVTFILCIAFAGLYLFQWALLTNKSIRQVEQVKANHRSAITEQQQSHTIAISQMAELNTRTIEFCHTVAHNIKMHIAKMSKQKLSITRTNMVDLLNTSLNTLEDLLSSYYQVQVRASIKLCAKPGILKTYARGQNNTQSRGGLSKIQRLNKKEIAVEDNYAYNVIMQRKLPYFSEGDLRNLSEKEDDSDVFFCEYGDQWDSIFLSSIVIPIRYPVISEQLTDYKMLGLICIDTEKTLNEWSEAKNKSYAYRTTAFFADAVYSLIDQYMKRQEQKSTLNQKKGVEVKVS